MKTNCSLKLPILLFFKEVREALDKEEPDFKTIYEQAKEGLGISYFHEMTEYFIAKGYDPLKSLDYIPAHYLSHSNIEEFTIPQHITKIRANAFSDCKFLLEIVIPPSVTKIENFAFNGCKELRIIDIQSPETDFEYFSIPSKTRIICPRGSFVYNKARQWGYSIDAY
ncbi:MAG: leucine-rich repeat protein [Acholeplasmatales bacterium]|nr:leucine-rich repeat protein [Acholeplasmatales bacterium]